LSLVSDEVNLWLAGFGGCRGWDGDFWLFFGLLDQHVDKGFLENNIKKSVTNLKL